MERKNWAHSSCICHDTKLTWGAVRRFISSSLVCRWSSVGLLFLRASRRKEVHAWTWFVSINTSTIWNLQKKKQFEKRMSGVITEEWIWSMLSRCSHKPVPNLICYEKFGENSEAYQQVLLVPLPFQSSWCFSYM